MAEHRVCDYMTRAPIVLEASNTLLDAAILLRTTGYRHLPIVEHGSLVGLISDRDIARLSPTMLLPHSAEEHHEVLRQTVVKTVMTRQPISTSPETPLLKVVDLMRNHKLGCLLVMEEGRLEGILTTRDLLRALHDQLSIAHAA